jgi:putative N6-adenine-specific DNA methylase
LVGDELRESGIAVGAVDAAGVTFNATAAELLTANLWSRIASRIVVRIAHFTARDFATLERRAKAVDWSLVIPAASVVRLRVTCRKSRLYHSDAVAERVARAIESRVKGVRVDQRGVDDDESDDSTQLIIVRFDHDECTISADSSGALLHRRGWRQAIAKAPLRETLAAAMLRACDWNGDCALVDPFCGSGTIGIEAALRARNIAPGLGRAFAMESWSGASRELSQQLRRDAASRAIDGLTIPIVMSDRDAGACAAALSNAERAGVAGSVTIVQRALSDVDLETIADDGLVLTNPPYGQRLSEGADLRGLYSRLGDIVRAGGNWHLAMLAPEQRLEVPLGMRLRKLFRTSNGGIDVSLQTSAVKTR